MRSRSINAQIAADSPAAAMLPDAASLRSRVGGYVVDMVIFAAIAMVIVVFAGFVLLLATDFAEQDAADADFYMFLALIGAGTPLVWTLMNLALLVTRGQTGGQYVAGLRVEPERGGRLSIWQALGWWFALNPLLFSWPMAAIAGFPLAAVVALLAESVTLGFTISIVLLCLLAPLAALIAALTDAHNRALHDRAAGVMIVPAA